MLYCPLSMFLVFSSIFTFAFVTLFSRSFISGGGPGRLEACLCQKHTLRSEGVTCSLGHQTWKICQCFAVFCTYVSNARVKGTHEMSVINLSDQFLFVFVDLQIPIKPQFLLTQKRQLQSPEGTQNEVESSHFATANPPSRK